MLIEVVIKPCLTVEEKVLICGRNYFYVQRLIFVVSMCCLEDVLMSIMKYDVLDEDMTSVTGYHISVNIHHVELLF